MKKIWIQLFIVIIGIMLCIVAHNGVKKYMIDNYVKKTTDVLVYNNYSDVSFEHAIITTTSTTTTPTTTTTLPITTTTTIPSTRTTTSTTLITKKTEPLETFKNEIIKQEKVEDTGEIVYDGMTLIELTNKLNESLTSTLTNTGHYFANYYIKTGLDPYLAVAIVLHETGCKWTCSKLVRECNNVGGMKGSPNCNGGSYKKYESLEEGINGYLDMLYNNYYSKGLTTPELINPKYAASAAWSEKINKYMEEIKS